MAKRTDIHTLSNFEPAAYDLVLSFSMASQVDGWPVPPVNVDRLVELRRTERFARVGAADGATNICDVCGAWFKHGDVWKHRATGEHITIGHTCADKFDMAAERGDWAKLRGAAINRAKARERRRQNIGELREQLREDAELKRALRCGHPIVRDMVERAIQWGSLSEKQAAFAKRLAAEEAEKAANPEPKAVPVPVAEGRQEITGKVLALKWKESDYGPSLKMLVQVEHDGGAFKVWGTCPSSLRDDAKRGDVVTFTAKVERSQDDPAFGFYKRPTKAQVVAPAEPEPQMADEAERAEG